MHWRQFTASAYQEPPSARMGHVAVLVDATGSWGEELLIVHGEPILQARFNTCNDFWQSHQNLALCPYLIQFQ